jgi:hypothetical protein
LRCILIIADFTIVIELFFACLCNFNLIDVFQNGYFIEKKCQTLTIFSPILGAFTVTRELYPLGFYLVIITKTDDMICQTPLKSITGLGDSFPVIFDRVKDIELNIVGKIKHKFTFFSRNFIYSPFYVAEFFD